MRNELWTTRAQCKKALTPFHNESHVAGAVLYHENGRNWIHGGEEHILALGVSGCGKTRRGTVPFLRSCIDAGESFIAYDPKGDLYQLTAGAIPEGYRVRVIDFRHVYESLRWNPLQLPYELYRSGDPVKKEVAMEIVEDLAHSLYPTVAKDPFWSDSARTLFVAVIFALFKCAAPEEIHMGSLVRTVMKGDERFASSTYLKELVACLPKDSTAAMQLHSYITTANDTRGGIRSSFLEGIAMFTRSEGLLEMLGSDDLRINELDGQTPTAIYIIVPDETPIFDSLAGVLMSQLMGHYIRMAQDRYNGTLPIRLNVCIEELGNVGKAIANLPHLMSAGRSRGLRLMLVLQALSQLDDLYGESRATTILSNVGVTIAYRVNHWKTLQELSVKCGERETECNGRVSREPLITPSQLGAMQTGQALVMVSGRLKFITWLPDYTEMFDCGSYQPPLRQVRVREGAPRTFDLEAFVKEARRREFAGESPQFGNSQPIPPVQAPARFGAPTPSELDQILSDIQSSILTGEPRPAEKSRRLSQLVILEIGENRQEVVKTLATALELSGDAVDAALSVRRPTFPVATAAKANALRRQLSALGCKAVLMPRDPGI